MKLISLSSSWMFCKVIHIQGPNAHVRFFLPSDDINLKIWKSLVYWVYISSARSWQKIKKRKGKIKKKKEREKKKKKLMTLLNFHGSCHNCSSSYMCMSMSTIGVFLRCMGHVCNLDGHPWSCTKHTQGRVWRNYTENFNVEVQNVCVYPISRAYHQTWELDIYLGCYKSISYDTSYYYY